MDNCFQSLLSGNLQTGCISLIVSKLLGYLIIIFSFILKLPQIKNMFQLKSDKGLSYISNYLEVIIFLCSSVYGYHYKNPFSTYGENIIIFFQTLMILILCWRYGNKPTIVSAIGRLGFLFSLVIFILSAVLNIFPEYVWFYIGSCPIPLASVSKISQIYESFKSKNTGPLSAFTFILALGGSIVRIFTTITETNDFLMIFTYAYGALLNLIILIQIFIYGNKSEVIKEKSS